MYPQQPTFPIREFMIWWNTTFPVDYWYRQKHKIAFNSKDHRDITLFDILCEWEEDNLTTQIQNDFYNEKQFEDYKQTGSWLRDSKEESTKQDWDQFLQDDDWDKFDNE